MLKKVIKLLLGPSAGHILTLILTPFFMHFYKPVAFGQYAFFIALLGILVNVSVLRFDAILLICEDNEFNGVIKAGNLSSATMTTTIALILYFLGYEFFLCFFFSLLAVSTQLIVTSLFIKNDKHHMSSFANFIFVSLIPLCQLLLTIIHIPNGLIIGHSVAGFIYLLIFIPVCIREYISGKASLKISILLRKYRSYYTFNALSILINAFSNQFLPISVRIIFGTDMLGLINVLQRILITPVSFILRIVIQAYNRELAWLVRDNKLKNAHALFKRTIFFGLAGVLVANLIMLSIYIIYKYADIDLNYKFSSEWVGVIHYIPYFLALLAFQMIAIPVSQSLTFLSCHLSQLIIELFRVGFFIILAFYSYYSHVSNIDFIKYFVFIQSSIYLIALFVMNKSFRLCIYKGKI